MGKYGNLQSSEKAEYYWYPIEARKTLENIPVKFPQSLQTNQLHSQKFPRQESKKILLKSLIIYLSPKVIC